MADELWTEVRDIIQEAMIQAIPKKKKCKKAKQLSEEALQIAMKRREVKGKGISFLFSAICKALPDNHVAFLHFFFLGMVLINAS